VPRYPSEVFGYPVSDRSQEVEVIRQRGWCPFVDDKCNKESRLVDGPFGVCSVHYGDSIIALCPRRFLERTAVFRNIAHDHFGGVADLLTFSEVGVRGIGRFDYVLVKHRPLSSQIEDFCVIEFQTGQTTSTGELVRGYNEFLKGEDVRARSYAFGLNLADIWKRTFTQILNKGIVLEDWRHKIYWVVQEPIFQDFTRRYGLQELGYSDEHRTVFLICDIVSREEGYKLTRTRKLSASVDDLFRAFRSNTDIPPLSGFLSVLERRIEDNAQLELRLGG